MKRTAVFLMSFLISMMGIAQDGDWELLFNGKNLRGWEKLDGTADYRIEDGEIIGTSRTGIPNSFLATKKTYGDFILEYEMKMDPGLNSGVQIRSSSHRPDGSSRVNGYQIECDDHSDRPWAGGIYEEAGRGWLYPMSYNLESHKVFKRGDWNQYRVEAIGNSIRTYINGVSFANLVDDARVEGIIALQVHGIGNNKEQEGKEISWRNIRILTENPASEIIDDIPLSPEVSFLTNELSDNQIKDGWVLLWDGKTTDGWRGAKLDAFPDKGWVIKDGALSAERSGGAESAYGGDIITVDTYQNFILEVDFKITSGANSGIKYFVDPELNKGTGSAIGCEYQILDDAIHPDAKAGVAGNRTLAALYDLIPPNALLYGQDNNPKRVNRVGNWNRARIEVHGNNVSHHLNGIKVLEYTRGTQMWRALVAYSKYARYPAFGEAESGHILLQDHGDQVSFKNIKILELTGK
jgi:hypothetical protein